MAHSSWLKWVGVLLLGLGPETLTIAQAPAFNVPYAKPFEPGATLEVTLGFNAGPGNVFIVDTGSVGIVVPKSELPRTITQIAAGSIKYTSSGLVVDGFWTDSIDITLGSSNAVARVPVFAATTSHCVLPASNPCRAGSLPHLMGVGFGRPESYASPDRNPLLHIKNMPLGRPSNYRLTHAGIELGLPHALGIKGMQTIMLTPWTRPGLRNQPLTDYKTPLGAISINGGVFQQTSILIDTGIPDSLIALVSGEPAECVSLLRKSGNCVIANGTLISLGMLSDAVRVGFTFGDNGQATPDSGHWIDLNAKEGSFINTGRRLLANFDVFYDYTHGIFGLSPAGPEVSLGEAVGSGVI